MKTLNLKDFICQRCNTAAGLADGICPNCRNVPGRLGQRAEQDPIYYGPLVVPVIGTLILAVLILWLAG